MPAHQHFALIGELPAERPLAEGSQPFPGVDDEHVAFMVERDALQVVQQPRVSVPESGAGGPEESEQGVGPFAGFVL